MSSPLPQQPYLKSGSYDLEANTFADINNLLRAFGKTPIRPSLSSPPLAKDVQELTLVYDKTANRIYTKVDGALRYVQFT